MLAGPTVVWESNERFDGHGIVAGAGTVTPPAVPNSDEARYRFGCGQPRPSPAWTSVRHIGAPYGLLVEYCSPLE